MKAGFPLLIAAVVFLSLIAGCSKEPGSSGSGSFGSLFGFVGQEPPSPGSIGPAWTRTPGQVQPYQVSDDLSNIANIGQFDLPEGAQALLKKNLFFVVPSDSEQLYHILEANKHASPRVPSFIAADTVLQTYHIFFNYTLREIEDLFLYDDLKRLTLAMLQESIAQRKAVSSDPILAQAAERNVAFFLVAAMLLEMQLPAGVQPEDVKRAEDELKLIREHAGIHEMTLLPYGIDYSQFVPRGHYTRTEKAQRYFRAMMWYGLVPFAVAPDPATGTTTSEDVIKSFMLISLGLNNAEVSGDGAFQLWQAIEEPTAFYVGFADDLTAKECWQEIEKTYGSNVEAAGLSDQAGFAKFLKGVADLREPEIKVQLLGVPGEKQFRFLGQRYIPDSEILQKLTHWPERPCPKGLDVMAILGSERARDLLDNLYKAPEQWGGYLAARGELTTEFSSLPRDKWAQNIYWSWLDSLDRLLAEFPEGYPSFMLSQAWQDKSLVTACASWAELRHDTILYAKQSGTVGMGPPLEEEIPKGYVEPNPDLYDRLLRLAQQSRQGLDKLRYLNAQTKSLFQRFEEMLVFLRDVSVKELNNLALTEDEYRRVMEIGSDLEGLTESIAGGQMLSETDRDMGVIADVHTFDSKCLEEGVGHAAEIFVVVPIEGKLYLTKGAVFTYYEFEHPAADRLTDEKWQEILDSGAAPTMPEWTGSFVLAP